MIKTEESGTELLDKDAHMDDASSANVSAAAATSLSASAASSPVLVPDATIPTATIPTGDLTTALILQQPQEAATLMPSATRSVTQQSHAPLLPLLESAETPSGNISTTADLQPRLDGLYTFPDDVDIFPPNGQAAQTGLSYQLQHSSTGGTTLSTDSWSDWVPNSQPVDNSSESFPLTLPFQPVLSATPMTQTLQDLGTLTTTAAQTATVGLTTTTAPKVPSSAPKVPSSAIPSSMNPSFVFPPLETPSLKSPSLEIPSSVTPYSVMPTSQALPSATPCSVTQSSEEPSSHSPPNHQYSVNTLTIEEPPNGATTTSTALSPLTANSVETSLTNLTALSAKSSPDHNGKENTEVVEVTTQVGNTKKRKYNGISARPKRKLAKEDNSKTVDMRTTQEDAMGESGAAEIAATRSGRRSNLPGHLKDAGYAPPKRNVRK